MAINIFDLAKDVLSSSVLSSQANAMDENEGGISKAIGALLPVVMGGLTNKTSGNSEIFEQLKNLGGSNILSNLGAAESTSNPVVGSLLRTIFGDKIGNIVSLISNFAGIKNSSADSLLSLAGSTIFGLLGKQIVGKNLNLDGLTNLLSSQKGLISKAMPAGLSLGSLGLGGVFDSFSSSAKEAGDSVSHAAREVESEISGDDGGSPSWLKWLFPLILLGLLLWWFWPNNKTVDEVVTDTTEEVQTVLSDAADRVKETFTFKDISITAFRGGIENHMIDYLNSGKYETANEEDLKENWYDFDNVKFVHGSSSELETGQEQLENIAKIMKAFPDAKIKIGAYTDKTGDDAANIKISQERADFIKNLLTDLGVGEQITNAEGYGSEFATVPAEASDDERAVDRKMAIRFSK
ncbi:MAG: OmpA family protein [Weeksellaceae bacterium]